MTDHTLLWSLLELAWFAVAATVILLERRSAAATIAWLFVMAFLPIVGLIVYRLIGPIRLERKRLRRRAGRLAIEEATGAMARLREVALEDVQVASVPMALAQPPPMPASAAALYFDGADAYSAILAAVAAAKHHVHLEYYIWEPDKIGTELRDALIERAKAGVQVRMIVDATGSNKLKKPWLEPLRAAGVEVAVFNPIRLRSIRLRRPDF